MTENLSLELGKLFDQPPPPPVLYKYLAAERVGNVLEGHTVRFTPLINTNDTFEVRSTMDRIAGPQFRDLLERKLDTQLSDDAIRHLAVQYRKENGLCDIRPDLSLAAAVERQGKYFPDMLRAIVNATVENMVIPHINDPKTMEDMFNRLGQEMLCFSHSERMDSAPMWAHYGDNNRGFIVAFDSDHEWFRRRRGGQPTRLHKVTYFDGKVEELLVDVRAALISKTADWAYEREWRLCATEDQIDRVVGDPADPIHLVEFPIDVVSRVILGPRADADLTARIRNCLETDYPHIPLFRAVPNRATHTYDEVII